MKKMWVVLVVSMLVIGYAEHILDECTSQSDYMYQADPDVQFLEEQMDRAKADGDIDRFKMLCGEYSVLNPSEKSVHKPQLIIHGQSPAVYNRDPSPPLWTDDQVVDSAYDYEQFSMDTRSNGTIWVAASKCPSSGDNYMVQVWWSDDGETWTLYVTVYQTMDHLLYPSLKIVEQDDSTYLVVAFTSREITSPFEEDVWCVRHAFDGSWTANQISSTPGVKESRPSIDSDDVQYSTIPYIYCAFESDDDIVFMRSYDFGETWGTRCTVAEGSVEYDYDSPSLAYGWHTSVDSCDVGVAWHYEHSGGTEQIRFRRNRMYGNTSEWLDTEYFTGETGHIDRYPSLGMTHGGFPSACITFARLDTIDGDNDFCNWYTYDGARTWTNDTLYSPDFLDISNCLSVDDVLGNYHFFFRGSDDNIRYKEGDYDDLAAPSGWTNSIIISDESYIGFTTPASAVRNGEPCVCWEDPRSVYSYIKFDALWAHGIEEVGGDMVREDYVCLAPNPCRDHSCLSYVVENAGRVSVVVFDATGRLVEVVSDVIHQPGEYTITLDNQELAAGVYVLYVKTPDRQYSRTMTVLK
jgi:hypothetical protein